MRFVDALLIYASNDILEYTFHLISNHKEKQYIIDNFNEQDFLKCADLDSPYWRLLWNFDLSKHETLNQYMKEKKEKLERVRGIVDGVLEEVLHPDIVKNIILSYI